MNSNTKWVLAFLVVLTIVGIQLYALHIIPKSYAEEIDTIEKEKKQLKNENIALQRKNIQMESELNQLKNELQELNKDFTETKKEMEETIKELEQELEKSTEEIEQLQKVNRQQEQEKKRLERELQARKEKRQVQIASRQKETPRAASSRSAASQSGSKKVMTGFEVTWYNTSGKTASGRPTQDGVTIAVDPNVIPLGTWVKLTFPDGTVQKRRADDTGSMVRGRRIDIYKDAPTKQLLNLGRVSGVKVEILD